MTYGGAPTTTNNDGIRLLVGDTSTSASSVLLSSAEYTFIATQRSNYWARGAMAARMIGGKKSDAVDRAIGDLRISSGGQHANFASLAASLDRMAALDASPFAGGISVARKELADSDSDRVSPSFSRGMDDNPLAGNQAGGNASTST